MSIFGAKHGRVVDEDILSNATLNMDGKRITNVAYPRDPVENSAYNGDVVTAKALSDFRNYLLDEVLLRNSDNVMDGRLEMSGHKTTRKPGWFWRCSQQRIYYSQVKGCNRWT